MSALVVFLSVLIVVYTKARPQNDRPIIGLVAQSTHGAPLGDTYIYADYVKFLEQAGARTVPIRVGQPKAYLLKLLSNINGVLFPGGAQDLAKSDFAAAARIIYAFALQANDAGDYFPLWGTCMGFQLLANLTAGVNLLKPTDTENISLPLDLKPDYTSSRLLGDAGHDVIQTLTTERVTPNFHHYSLLEKDFDNSVPLRKFYRIISTNKGRQGKVFVSTMEGLRYPFYATQWHPETISFLWRPSADINHGPDAVQVAQYMANFLVAEARKSVHQFPDMESESAAVMENYSPVYNRKAFMSVYYFNYTTYNL